MLGTCVWKLDTFFMNEWLGKPVLPTRGRPLVFPGELVLQRTDFWCCKGKFRCCRREFKDVCTIFFFPVLCFDGDTDSFRFFFSFGEKERFWKLFSFSVSSFPLNQLEGSGIPSVWYSGRLCNYSCFFLCLFNCCRCVFPRSSHLFLSVVYQALCFFSSFVIGSSYKTVSRTRSPSSYSLFRSPTFP